MERIKAMGRTRNVRAANKKRGQRKGKGKQARIEEKKHIALELRGIEKTSCLRALKDVIASLKVRRLSCSMPVNSFPMRIGRSC